MNTQSSFELIRQYLAAGGDPSRLTKPAQQMWQRQGGDTRTFQQYDRNAPVMRRQIANAANMAGNEIKAQANSLADVVRTPYRALQGDEQAIADLKARVVPDPGREYMSAIPTGKLLNEAVAKKLALERGATVEYSASPTVTPSGYRTVVGEVTFPDGKKGFFERPHNADTMVYSKLSAPRTGMADVIHGAEGEVLKQAGGKAQGIFAADTPSGINVTRDAFVKQHPQADVPGRNRLEVDYPENYQGLGTVGMEYYDKLHADNPSLWQRWERYNQAPKAFDDWLRKYNQSKE